MALTPKRLFLYPCISISLLRPYTLFSLSPSVNKTLFTLFSRKLTPTKQCDSTFSRELLAIYRSVRHFRPFLEGRAFYVATDHCALASALPCNADRYSPCEVRHL